MGRFRAVALCVAGALAFAPVAMAGGQKTIDWNKLLNPPLGDMPPAAKFADLPRPPQLAAPHPVEIAARRAAASWASRHHEAARVFLDYWALTGTRLAVQYRPGENAPVPNHVIALGDVLALCDRVREAITPFAGAGSLRPISVFALERPLRLFAPVRGALAEAHWHPGEISCYARRG